MNLSKKFIDQFRTKRVKVYLDDGTEKRGILKGVSDHPEASYYNSIFLVQNEDEDSDEDSIIPTDIIDDIKPDF